MMISIFIALSIDIKMQNKYEYTASNVEQLRNAVNFFQQIEIYGTVLFLKAAI